MTQDLLVNRYGSIAAEIYDLDKPFGALPDTAFHLERFAGFPGEILEPACGSGRTLIPFLEAGLAITGFDPSEEMLGRAKARAAAAGYAPDLTRQSFEDFAYARRFAAILVPVGSFTLLDDHARAAAVLRRMFDHLEPGGRLVLDIQGLAALQARADDRRRWTDADGDVLTLEGVRTGVDWTRQWVEMACRYERWRGGVLVETQLEIMRQRYWGLEEFRLTLEAAGFAEVEVCGGFRRGRAPRAGDLSWTFEAVRPA